VPLRALLVWPPVVLCAAWVIVRALGLERGFPMVALLAYTPLAAVAAFVLAFAAAALGQRAAAGAALVLAAVLGAFIAPRALGGDSAAEGGSGPTLRVLTANLHQEPATAEAVVAVVRAARADVLSVQELTPEVQRALAAAGLSDLLPERVVAPRSDAAGAGVYARVPLRRRLPVPGRSAPAAVRLRLPGAAPVDVYAVHPRAPQARAAMPAWRDGLRALPPATPDGAVRVLAGDFNATLDNAELRRVLDRGYEDAAAEVGAGLRATWPAGRRFPPPVTIDHVLADARCGWREVRVIPVPPSDHRAVLAEIVLPRT
jgi:endonuclease/exonuclease/phosphatase (EEP) superfamily protein YafD